MDYVSLVIFYMWFLISNKTPFSCYHFLVVPFLVIHWLLCCFWFNEIIAFAIGNVHLTQSSAYQFLVCFQLQLQFLSSRLLECIQYSFARTHYQLLLASGYYGNIPSLKATQQNVNLAAIQFPISNLHKSSNATISDELLSYSKRFTFIMGNGIASARNALAVDWLSF